MRNIVVAATLAILCGGLIASEPTPLEFNDFHQIEQGGGGQTEGLIGITFALSWEKTIHGQGQSMDWLALTGAIPLEQRLGAVFRVGFGSGGEVPAPNKSGQRDRDPDIVGIYAEGGARYQINFVREIISAYAEAGISFAEMYRQDTAGTAENFGGFLSVGIEAGTPFLRAYAETGIRGLIPITYSDSELRDTNSFHWVGLRIGIRVIWQG